MNASDDNNIHIPGAGAAFFGHDLRDLTCNPCPDAAARLAFPPQRLQRLVSLLRGGRHENSHRQMVPPPQSGVLD
jgi:hypothetical protein